MKTYIRRREKNQELVVLYSEWGMDENIFIPLCNDEFDLILFYDYSSAEPLVLPEMKTYTRIILIGWSLGVWAAGFLSEKMGIKPDVKIAVNGTPLPTDKKYGISKKVIEGTLKNLTEKNVKKFYLRVFGDKKTFLNYQDRLPRRTIKSLEDELRWMYNKMLEEIKTDFKWNYAVISEDDRVYPAKAQQTFWKTQPETKTVILPESHFPFNKWKNFPDFISYILSYKEKEEEKGKKKRK